jgi:prepilin-type N-terminal cleavage/methylation domain-containing protein
MSGATESATCGRPAGIRDEQSMSNLRRPVAGKDGGFTLLEMVVTIGILGVLAALLVGAIARGRHRSTLIGCGSNLRQLQIATILYCNDNAQGFPPNTAIYDGSVFRSTSNSWLGYSNAERDFLDYQVRRGAYGAGGYLGNMKVLKCPDDRSKVLDSGLSRIRSYSLNASIGGPTFRKGAEISIVKKVAEVDFPSLTFAFVDEHENSIDDGQFLVYQKPASGWVNMPSGRHGNHASLGFVDGHWESWKWRSPKEFPRTRSNGRTSYLQNASGPDLEDLRKIQAVSVPWIQPENETH